MKKVKLRNCSATVEFGGIVGVGIADTERTAELHHPIVLRSYNSRVAAIDDGVLYLFPRYDYSQTTTQHVHKFLQDYGTDMGYAELRERARDMEDERVWLCDWYVNEWWERETWR